MTALVEFKHWHWTAPRNLDHPSILALKSLADGHDPPLPLVIAQYHPEEWIFDVFPVNLAASAYFLRRITRISEREWCTFLHALRGPGAASRSAGAAPRAAVVDDGGLMPVTGSLDLPPRHGPASRWRRALAPDLSSA